MIIWNVLQLGKQWNTLISVSFSLSKRPKTFFDNFTLVGVASLKILMQTSNSKLLKITQPDA